MSNIEQPKTENDSRKIFTTLVLVLTLMICTTSATYAYFALSATNNEATGTAATASLTLTVTEAALKTTTNSGVMVPQKEAYLGAAMNGTNKCIDGNVNIICKVYTITVTNTSTAAVVVNGTIQFSVTGTNAEMSNLKWKRTTNATTLGSNTSVAVGKIDTKSDTPTISDTSSIFDLDAGTVCTVSSGSGCTKIPLAKTNGSKTYYIVIWINDPGTAQYDSGTWRATIKFEGENGTGVTSTITSST